MIKLTQLNGDPVWLESISLVRKPYVWETHAKNAGAYVATYAGPVIVQETPEQVIELKNAS